MLDEAAEECRKEWVCESGRVLRVRGDCASVEDMTKVRDTVIKGMYHSPFCSLLSLR